MILQKCKRRIMLLVLVISLVSVMGVVLPQQTVHATGVNGGGSSIKDKLTGTDKLETQVDNSTNSFLDKFRHIAIFGAIIFGIWLGICFFGAGFSPDTLRQTKIQSLAFLACLAFTFWTEPILGFLFGIFGVDIAETLK
ncbi:hypothetical protein QCD85_06185 [Paenibacillus sp. PsM32]|uniref:hypothetical protein n=1 Tax=unclassified Paenibacillus TaxID=185978 RepID=UPI0023669854|nr:MULTISPECIES: hypothetical protein [unclassified Paenibacillus]MDN4617679.1 hypothetical protein [Paenibacillus sp. PsM32]WDF52864.1 hypothetical protein PQ460_10760 [Paenibacillus sp. KACC 21273]